MLREPGLGPSRASHQLDAKWARGQRGARVAAGLLPFPATACLETREALISSLTKKFFAAPSLSAWRSFGYGVGWNELGHAEIDETGVDRARLRGEPCRNGGARWRWGGKQRRPGLDRRPDLPQSRGKPGHRPCAVHRSPCAPVAQSPSASEVPCKPDARTTEAWSDGPKCKSEKPGEG